MTSGWGVDLLLVAMFGFFIWGLFHAHRLESRSQRQWVPPQPPVDLDALDFRRQGGAERPERRAL